MSTWRIWDRRCARAEAATAVFVLLAMVLLASLQAALFNFAELTRTTGSSGSGDGLLSGWASASLSRLDWVDTFLQKGTLWITFLGASLATYDDKHIAVDAASRFASPALRAAAKRIVGVGVAVVCFFLAVAFFEACRVADQHVPFAYEWLTPSGPAHVCDAAPAVESHASRPSVLCALRAGLAALHVSVSSGGGIAQLIAPVMLVVIGLRSLLRAGLGASD